jgi:hypothetical protein
MPPCFSMNPPAATASVINAGVPLAAFGLAIPHGIEPFRWRGLVGGDIAVVRIAVIPGDQLSANVPVVSLLALIAGGLCATELPVIVKLVGVWVGALSRR